MILLCVVLAIIVGLNYSCCIYELSYKLLFTTIIAISYILFICFKFEKKIRNRLLIVLFFSFLIGVIRIPINLEKHVFTGTVISSKENYYILQDGLNRFYIYEKNNMKEIGDVLTLQGTVSFLNFEKLESSFDFESYLNKKGIYYQLYVIKENVLFQNFIRKKVVKNFLFSNLSEKNCSFISTILFSDIDGDYTEIQEMYLFYLFTSSGMHISFFVRIFEKIFLKFLPNKKAKFVSLICFIPFIFLLDYKANFFRISIFRILEYLRNKYKNSTRLNNLSLSMLLLIVFDYHVIFDKGFLFSSLFSFIGIVVNGSFHHLNKKMKKVCSIIVFTMISFFINMVMNYELNVI